MEQCKLEIRVVATDEGDGADCALAAQDTKWANMATMATTATVGSFQRWPAVQGRGGVPALVVRVPVLAAVLQPCRLVRARVDEKALKLRVHDAHQLVNLTSQRS